MLVILSELVNVLLIVEVVKWILVSCGSTITVVLLSIINLYHCTSSLLMLLSNTQVNVVDLP